jgi:hypothetical protein
VALAAQRLRSSLSLVGTAILGASRYAIMQQQGQPPVNLRLKVGDTFEGFRLSEIREKSVVFTRGPARVELALDFSRRPEGAKPGLSAPPRPQPPAPRAPAAQTPARPDNATAAERAPRVPRQLQLPQQPGQPQQKSPSTPAAPAENP